MTVTRLIEELQEFKAVYGEREVFAHRELPFIPDDEDGDEIDDDEDGDVIDEKFPIKDVICDGARCILE